MDFEFTDEQEQFRREIRIFLETKIKDGIFKPDVDAWTLDNNAEFTRQIAKQGWIGMTWPKEYGGKGRSYLDRFVFMEELMRYGAPLVGFLVPDRQMGPAIIAHGNEEQKQYYLPRIIRGEIQFAIGMSEPQAGSDLGGLETRAIEKDDCFVIDGQKVWTSGASHSEYIYMVARTSFDKNISNAKSISEFIVDLKTPGITIRPLIDITNGNHWTEVFFDNVRVPKFALMGEKNKGFYQIMSQLDNERSGIERMMSNYLIYNNIIEHIKNTKRHGILLCKNANVRSDIVDLMIKLEVGKALFYRVAWALDKGEKEKANLTKYTTMAKVFGNRFEQELDNTVMNICGLYGQLDRESKETIINGMVARAYLFSPAHSIQAGTLEILLNALATRGLGLPRD